MRHYFLLNLISCFAEIVSEAEGEDKARLPTARALVDVHRRAVKKCEQTYPVIDKISALPEQLPAAVAMITSGGERLEWCHVGHAGTDSYIMLATEKQLECARNATVLCLDGTFAVASPPFVQVLVMNAIVNGHAYPCAHLLLASKRTTAHTVALQARAPSAAFFRFFLKALVEKGQIRHVNHLITDMEIGLALAAEAAFHVPGNFCYFHFTQAILRHLRNTGHIKLYESDEVFRSEVIVPFRTLLSTSATGPCHNSDVLCPARGHHQSVRRSRLAA